MALRIGFDSRWRAAAGVGAAMALSMLALIGVARLVPTANSASLAASAAENAAFTAIQNETTSLGSADTSALTSGFSGDALATEQNLRLQVRKMITSGTDYPGRTTLSNIQIMGLTGDYQATMTLDFAAHVTLANMKNGAVQDYSRSDLIYHVVLTNVDGAWKVNSIASQFAPGGGP